MQADIVSEVEELSARVGAIRAAVGRSIFGQDDVVDQTLITLLSGGHALLVGVPGLGKSRLVETLGVVLGLNTKRVQFTPDLMPADITGSEVLDEHDGRRSFRFVPGPVFCQLLMADEINRASPRTQSALLQSMQEQRVAVGGVEHKLPRPFHVLATQNPIEQEGTYPLPEAQLDRFLLQIDVGYPSLAAERTMLLATTGAVEATPVATLFSERLFGRIGLLLASLALMVSVFGSLNGNLLVGPRLLFAMGEDGLAPRALYHLHPTWGTPARAIAVLAGWCILLVLGAGMLIYFKVMRKALFDVLTNYAMFGAVSFETLAVASIFMVRRQYPVGKVDLPYRCWGYPIVPALYIVGASVIPEITFRVLVK